MLPQRVDVALVTGVVVQRDLETVGRAPWELDELAELVHLEAVGAPAVLDRPERPAPGRDRGEAVALPHLDQRPILEHHRLANRAPVDSSGRNRAVVAADPLTDREVRVVSRDVRALEPLVVPELG